MIPAVSASGRFAVPTATEPSAYTCPSAPWVAAMLRVRKYAANFPQYSHLCPYFWHFWYEYYLAKNVVAVQQALRASLGEEEFQKGIKTINCLAYALYLNNHVIRESIEQPANEPVIRPINLSEFSKYYPAFCDIFLDAYPASPADFEISKEGGISPRMAIIFEIYNAADQGRLEYQARIEDSHALSLPQRASLSID